MRKVKNIKHKVCKDCGEDKSVEHYYFDKVNQRYESRCKFCKIIYQDNYAEDNKDRIKAYMKERYTKLKSSKNASTIND